MKTYLIPLILLVLAILIGGVVWSFRVPITAKNPDPNHTHADFAVWVLGKKLDFSSPRFMTSESQEQALPQDSPKKYIHLHDDNGNVAHLHKPGLTLGDLLKALDATIESGSGGGMCLTFPQAGRACDDANARWTIVVNGTEHSLDPGVVVRDLDRILVSYGADATELAREAASVTDVACLYSRTCPRRGKPPTENCIADPKVPCVVP